MSARRIARNLFGRGLSLRLDELVASRSYPQLAAKADALAPALVITLVRVALVLQGLHDLLDAGAIFVTSGYRTPELHAAIYAPKPAPASSMHLTGRAADFELEELESIKAFVRIAKLGIEDPAELPGFDRLCLYSKRGHLHLDITADPLEAPRHLLYIDSGSGWRPVSYADAAALLEAA